MQEEVTEKTIALCIVALGNGLGHVKAGIKAAADAVVIFPSFSGMSFSL